VDAPKVDRSGSLPRFDAYGREGKVGCDEEAMLAIRRGNAIGIENDSVANT